MKGEEIEFGARPLAGLAGVLIPLLAAGWSIFQLAVAGPLLLDSVYIRAIHLAFGLSLVFLSFPFRAEPKKLQWWELLLALVAGVAALYLAIDYEAMADRQGAPLLRDVLFGGMLLFLVLEGARRALGPALPMIATLFLLMTLFASSLPDFLASRSVSLPHLVAKMTMGTEGIYGIPLRVSADTVFLFVLFGALLDKAGGGHYFVTLATALLGRFRGGPAKAAVLASGLTGMVSGSSIANTVTTGTFTIPLMKRSGYPATKAAAIEVAASTNGQLMPPIMGAAAFIIGEYCRLPYIEVVRAAFLPAMLSYLGLLYIVHLEACRLGLDALPRNERPPIGATLVSGVPYFFPVGFLLYELVVLRHSAPKAAVTAIGVLALLIMGRSMVSSRSLRPGLTQLWEALVAAGRNMMGISVAVAAAGVIVGVVSMGLGSKMTHIIGFLSGGNLYGLLLVTALLSLLLGMGLPTTANYIVMANLTAPAILAIAGEQGIAIPLLAAHLFCFYFGILADDTPPVGLAAYAASAIAKSPPLQTGMQGFAYDLRTAILPFAFILNPRFLLIGVDGLVDITLVMLQGLLGLAAFCAMSRGWMFHRLFLWEKILLAVATFLLLFGQQESLPIVGGAIVLFVALSQQRTKGRLFAG